ncbi:MAG: hypothetical protein JXR81_00910 [Candidatus Goldbacteria bacterium]|nr:hypothetical protein [Candidatus Goldiibacteriota bacterium]
MSVGVEFLKFIGFVIVFIAFFQWLFRFILQYKVKQEKIVICLFGIIPVFFISINNIKSIRKGSSLEGMVDPFASRLNIRNNIWGETTIIERKDGMIFYEWAITPDNPDEFIKAIQLMLKIKEN